MTTTIKNFSKMLFAFVLCAGLVLTSCETADPTDDNSKNPENSENTDNSENTESTETPSNIIVFADDIVKKSCVEAFDTNGDGEISYEEAAAVKDLSDAALGFLYFSSFDEFQYFINVTSIPDSYFCENEKLKSIVLPKSIETIGEKAFWGCTTLTYINFPQSLKSIGKSAFFNCI